MKNVLAGIFLFTVMAGSADAALLSRLSGAAYYDDMLDITWLADTNLADTNAFGVTGINDDGTMIWVKAIEWIAAMNAAVYLGSSEWRLPAVTDTGTPGCNSGYTGTDCGWNVDLATGEMAHLFYGTLGNTGNFDTSGAPTGCIGTCLTNAGPFLNFQPAYYWYGTEHAPNANNGVWAFLFISGVQASVSKTGAATAWAVASGDIAEVPVPGVAWLFGVALALSGAVRRRRCRPQNWHSGN